MTITVINENDFATELQDLRELQAKKEFLEQRAIELGNDLERYYQWTDAKLHDASYYKLQAEKDFPNLTEEEINSEFESMCEIEWNDFYSEYIESKGLTLQHIGRTSTFRIVPKNNYTEFHELETEIRSSKHDYVGQLLDWLEEDLPIKKDFFAKYDHWEFEDKLESYVGELDDALGNFEYILETIKSDWEDIKRAYQYLNRFKKNQVDTFKIYLESR